MVKQINKLANIHIYMQKYSHWYNGSIVCHPSYDLIKRLFLNNQSLNKIEWVNYGSFEKETWKKRFKWGLFGHELCYQN